MLAKPRPGLVVVAAPRRPRGRRREVLGDAGAARGPGRRRRREVLEEPLAGLGRGGRPMEQGTSPPALISSFPPSLQAASRRLNIRLFLF